MAEVLVEGAAMGAPVHCPYCGMVRDAGDRSPVSAGEVLEGLYEQVELIRKMAEMSSQQAREITLLRETIARLRGARVHEAVQVAVQETQRHPDKQHAAAPPLETSAGPRETSAAQAR
jgi:hypothetical protein